MPFVRTREGVKKVFGQKSERVIARNAISLAPFIFSLQSLGFDFAIRWRGGGRFGFATHIAFSGASRVLTLPT